MYHLKLIKALSFTGIVTATKKNPDVFVEDRITADAVAATGYFKLIEGGAETPEDGGEKEPGKTLEEMTVLELETFAAYHNVSLKGISKKADIIAKLRVELCSEETENEVDYGSPTMTWLQEQ